MPHLGTLENIEGSIPHPGGQISVSYKLQNKKWSISIQLPNSTDGTFIWKGKSYPLKGGNNQFSI